MSGSSGGMYQVRWQDQDPPEESLPLAKTGTTGKSVKLKTNCFRMNWNEDSFLHRYVYELPSPNVTREEEQKMIEEVWSSLRERMDHFVVRRPGLIFSPKVVKDFKVELKSGGEVKVSYVAKTPGDQMNVGHLGPAAVVGHHIVRRLAEPFRIQKVGKRYYSNCPQANRGAQVLISGFVVNMANLNAAGPILQLDVVHRPLSQKTMVDVLKEICEGNESDVWAYNKDKDVAAEWTRFCVSATVVTQYNSRVYRIKAVHFDKTPQDEFVMYQRDNKKYVNITYLKYFEAFYQMRPNFVNQPLLEAFPEKASEQVFLLPELCVLTGISDEMRKDKNTMQEALKNLKAAPQDRLSAIISHVTDMQKDARPASAIKAWGCNLSIDPIEADGRVLEPVQVAFQEKKVYPIEDGQFTKLLRNGLQCAVKLDEWILLYPASDESVLHIWLRSLRDIAQVAFGMQLVEPKREKLEQIKDLEEELKEKIPATTQLVLMLIPNKDSPKIYQKFKKVMTTKIACISQVVRSETIRKRQSIAAVLSKVVLQINAKFCGPLWTIVSKDNEKDMIAQSLKSAPFSILGLDVHRNNAGERALALTGTLDKSYSQHFSTSALLDKADWQTSLLQKLQNLFRDALVCFAGANQGILPEKIVVYRASVSADDMDLVHAEIKAMQDVLDVLVKGTFGRSPEDRPKITYVAIARRGNMRIFAPSEDGKGVKNPETGTVLDDPKICPSGLPSFYLVSQAIGKGSAIPSFYSVVLNENDFSMDVIQNLTYRLCLMYYNSSSAVRVPAPVLYAMKLAKMIGSVVKQAPLPALQRSLYYL